jgi:probable rRNA maturation factor
MTPQIHIDRETGLDTPDDESFSRWVTTTLEAQADKCAANHAPEISIRINNETEMSALNARYRHKSGPTNVLSFPADLPPEIGSGLLGDIVICAPVVEREARTQGKPAVSHWAHMTVHGTLHLLGFDHIEATEAEQMENLETRLLLGMGYADPYQNDNAPLSTTDSEHT